MKTSSPFQVRLTIRTKLIASCFILLVIPILIVGAVSYRTSANETNALIEKNIQNNVEMAKTLIASFDESAKKGLISKEEAQERVKTALLGPKNGDKRQGNKEIDLGENGYFYVLDEKGTLLAHPSMEGQNIWDKKTSGGFYYIQDVIQNAKNGGGFTTYSWPLPNSQKEAPKIVYANLYPDWGWIVSAGSYIQDYNQGLRNIQNIILMTLISCFVAGLAFALLFARHISKPLAAVAKQTARIAEGDLTDHHARITNKDEIGALGNRFSQMGESLRQLVRHIRNNSDLVSHNMSQLTASVHEVAQASNQIAASVQEISQLTHTQAHHVEESANAMEEMAAGIQRIAATSSDTLAVSEHMAREAQQGNLSAMESTARMTALRTTVQDLAAVIEQLTDRSQEIGSIVEVITEISDQTNLLSLNAAIEAARAGESGQGFAVVAAEIRKLAERSAQSAGQVSGLIETIQQHIAYTVAEMKRSEQEVESGAEIVAKTGDAFQRIMEATKQTAEQIEEASAASEELSASSQQIAASLQDMKRASKATADTAQSISSFTEEQLAAMEAISSTSAKIGAMAEELQSATHRFKL
ncbi:Methyl-accepting chemotaxis protein McpB [Paenibacillus sp. CECT 9249]|uniref:methyl-accepting chemotaxis protein n=1 Tax=Paenibacillus sp. CECT 9249 TaxID=2845385 RepID=UPI001E3B85C7|nr:methyl-accepting chemotaxis protein [Paenibacillus sp. CECT 9249]CAH0121258.1 Methyl-accepting chemotaxis protein McpB [Paenibacillus sp. CECT 9249]